MPPLGAVTLQRACLAVMLWASTGFYVGFAFNFELSAPIIVSDPHGVADAATVDGEYWRSHSYFGYSVGLFNYSDAADDSSNKTWILVGAPRGNYSNESNPLLSGLTEPGVVFKCSIFSSASASDDGCTEMHLDPTGNFRYPNIAKQNKVTGELKDNGWLGTSIDVQPSKDGRLVVCGHLRKQLFRQSKSPLNEIDDYLANGVCYWTYGRSLSNPAYHSPAKLTTLDSEDYQFLKEPTSIPNVYLQKRGFCVGQLGTAAHFVKTADGYNERQQQQELLLGAPGVNGWRGTVARLKDKPHVTERRPGATIRFPAHIDQLGHDISHDRQQPSKGIFHNFGDAVAPLDVSTSVPVLSYFGYSVSSGFFTRDRLKAQYVAGAPHAAPEGKVFIFDYQIKAASFNRQRVNILWEMNGTQNAEYFGAAVAVLDVNGDGLDDVVVGAPLHSIDPTKSGAGVPDQGRIAVFENDNGRFSSVQQAEFFGSKAAGARFGTTLSAIGDIDRDGYEDLAVGAPYEDDGAGAVYLLLGSSQGLRFSPSQGSIRAAQWSTPLAGLLLKGFGTSISRGVDMDGNAYPDLAVGSYASGHVVLLRTRPVARVRASIMMTPQRLEIPSGSSAKSETATVASVEVCLDYTAHDGPPQQEMIVELSVDTRRRQAKRASLDLMAWNGRAGILSGYTVLLTTMLPKDSKKCETAQLRLLSGVKDFASPISIEAHFHLPAPGKDLKTSAPDSWVRDATSGSRLAPVLIGSPSGGKLGDFCKTCPILDPALTTFATYEARFVNGCGDDACVTDLMVTAEWRNKSKSFLVIGARGEATLAIQVRNVGKEPAYSNFLQILLSEYLTLSDPPIGCVSPTYSQVSSSDSMSLWTCDIPGHIQPKDYTEFDLRVKSSTGGDIRKYRAPTTVTVTASSNSQEKNDTDNTVMLTADLEVDADLTIQGNTIPKVDVYTTSANVERAVGGTSKQESNTKNKFYMSFEVVKSNPTPIDEVVAEFVMPAAFAVPLGTSPFLMVTQAGSNKNLRCQSCVMGNCSNLKAPESTSQLESEIHSFADTGMTIGNNELVPLLRAKRSPPTNKSSQVTSEEIRNLNPSSLTDVSSQFQPLLSNETYVANCSSSGQFICAIITCFLGPFRTSYSTETVSFNIELDMGMIEPMLTAYKTPNLEYQVEAEVRFGRDLPEETRIALEKSNVRPDQTTISVYLKPRKPTGIPVKYILMAAGGGIAILLLILTGLVKAGFFKRTKLEEIKEIKEQDAALKRRTLMLMDAAADGQVDRSGADDEILTSNAVDA